MLLRIAPPRNLTLPPAYDASDVSISPAVMARLDSLFQPQAVAGSRYNAQGNSEVDTEVFPVN